ncbi:MAG: 50S ribosomal protein L11 methyltransferase [Bacteroidota bacterium]|nr:50S ribosomal protein L11 methyltransferase [Bacteroidota bacterium]
MGNFLKIEIEIFSDEEAEILIADLSDIQFYAFEQEENLLIAYIKEEDVDEEKLKEILVNDKHFKKTIIKNENWNQQWESELKPVVINDFVAIRAFFHEPVKNVKHELLITPKMSFGTGHHATTFLMIEQSQNIDFRDKTVIDFGTGTGVLAILAEKLGAFKVLAIDYDEWSINNALENIRANDCKNISVEKRDDLSGLSQVDIMLANINRNVLTEKAESIIFLLKKGSFLLTSGFLAKDEAAIENLFAAKQFIKKCVMKRDDWLSVLFQKL